MFPDRILSLCLGLARDGTAAEELWGWEKTAPFDGEVGQLEECRLIGNTEVNGKYAITSVFFIRFDRWADAVTEVTGILACTSVVAERV